MLTNGNEASALTRAAVGYAGLGRDHGQVARLSGISKGTLDRILSPTNDRAPNLEERYAIADACGVPRRFMELGFREFVGLEARVRELEARMNVVAGQLPAEIQRLIDAAVRESQRSPGTDDEQPGAKG